FAYGLHGISRQYLERNLLRKVDPSSQLKAWWATAASFDKRWTFASVGLVLASLLGWLLYASSRSELIQHLQTTGFPGEFATTIARFSLQEVGWYVLFLVLSVLAVVLIVSGTLSGPRAKWAGIVLGFVIVTDYGRANAPWVIYYNYR